MLRENEISYIVAGKDEVDLVHVVEQLGKHFGIRRLLLEGGGHINGGFLEAGLVDELSLLIAPAIDGRPEIPTVFDGVQRQNPEATRLQLTSVEQRAGGVLWLRYEISK
jgi:riboflavin biosynthesis pyrimidine reductase